MTTSERNALLWRVIRATDITDSALARKLAVTVDTVEAWKNGTESLTDQATAELELVLARTRCDEPDVSPRVDRPRLESAIVCADSIAYLKDLPAESADMILSDIPYGIGLEEWDVLHANSNSAYLGSSSAQKKAGDIFKKRRKPINGWSSADSKIPEEYYTWCRTWASEWLRVLRPGGSAMVFAGRRLAHRCVAALEDAGFNYRDMVGWIRPQAAFRAQRLGIVYKKRGDLAHAERWDGWRVGNLRPSFEPIIWCFKPYAVTIADNMLDHWVGAINTKRFEALTGGLDNVIQVGFSQGEAGFHEAQKPVHLMRILIELCTSEDQLILDPFAGSGSTAVAAHMCGRRYLAIERDEAMCEVARQRLASTQGANVEMEL